DEGAIIFYTDPADLATVRDGLKEAGANVTQAELVMVPKTTVRVEGKEAEQLLKLLEALDDQEDVQEVVANFDMPEEILAKVAG
ncbi:YebC/PmpR family DNA-binding transcriptional regulator, partial [Candidatus Bipolaricaulota bacterium]|nr:YebC/PmpR family DNA-binding transcriptional regulator [Candidatus Bipolaricaulota bacterium]